MNTKAQPGTSNPRQRICAAIGALLCVACLSVNAATFTKVHDFGGLDGSMGTRYHSLIGNSVLMQGPDGNLYGTAHADQSSPTCGTIFRVSSSGNFTKLHEFTQLDGCNPHGGLTLGRDGAFYGTTHSGGTYNSGVIFRVTRAGATTVLAHFPSAYDAANVGLLEKSALTLGSDGNFYGVARRGGNGYGTLFKASASGNLTLLHKFNYGDGSEPDGPLVQGTDGSFYGTTPFGGNYHQGSAFKITRTGAFTVLHHFGATASSSRNPAGALVQLNDGNFYGVSTNGGVHAAGTLYKMTPTGAVTRLYSFNGDWQGKGAYPYGGLIKGKDGKLYGATSTGGTAANNCDCGVFFRATSAGGYVPLAAFDGARGKYPYHALPVQHTNGAFFGLAVGGAYQHGVIYKLTP